MTLYVRLEFEVKCVEGYSNNWYITSIQERVGKNQSTVIT
jgi:hypothetical protein